MATSNPTGDGSTVVLSVPEQDRAFLRRMIVAAKAGLRDELDQFGDELEQPIGRLLREEASYGTLLAGLGGEPIRPDAQIRATLAGLAEAIDEQNEHERVVFEHAATHNLMAQLEGAAS